MQLATEIVSLVAVVLVVTGIARRLDWSPPLLLVVVGVGASFVPGVPEFQLDPELVLVGLLPPLLYATALRTSLVDIRVNRAPIALLSVGLVIFTTLTVGVVTWLVVPGLPLAAGFALGAVVAPPDAVAASAVARRVGMPRRVVRILEGESLLNDAAALVALRTAIAAISGSVALWEAGLDFLLAAVGGAVVGWLIGWGAGQLRKRLRDPVLDTAWSFVVPFVAYLPAEEIHGSGVLAVVVAGLVISQQTPRLLSGPSRLASRLNWRTIQFLLENLVFLLIGLQLRRIVTEVADSNLSGWAIAGICLAVLGVTIASRIAWVFAAATRRVLPAWALPWRYSAAIAWAGMRGVVTLAAAFVLPAGTPQRGVLVLAAFVVVAGTLLLQGTTLPKLVRRLDLPAPDPGEDALQKAALLHDMTQAGLARLKQVQSAEDPPDVIARLEDKQTYRSDSAWERLGTGSDLHETPSAAYRRLRMAMLEAEREVLLTARDRATVDDEVLRSVLDQMDVEESILGPGETVVRATGRELRTPEATAGTCAHLADPGEATSDAAGCEDCVREGSTWVHLRLCLTCGHVGCCDSSERRHATRHYHETQHPVIRSYEPGEDWRWCFIDRTVG
ncbi:Na+/H+ antiporter [Amycolatopsis alkalitolerans]|uniref:Na+/H+ antiporter n=1 Tax=Amycolatopsis alkalitolerans TaxID=2547244 RepID=A0A5C4M4F0_9PSEU|nr:Na+/H+ antiporter [Amycolatopsis alkalitolerans]TNC27009.1 Na+/H+ antiporter [Amycolatopsis alkalitolerans]